MDKITKPSKAILSAFSQKLSKRRIQAPFGRPKKAFFETGTPVENPTIILSTTAYTYNGSQCTPTPTVKYGDIVISNSEYYVNYTDNINAGIATCTIFDKPGGKYIISEASITFTINKAPTEITTVPTAKTGLTYNGGQQALVNSGRGNSPLYYSLNNGEYTVNIPSGTDATTYTVNYMSSGDTNHSGTTSGSVSVTISPSAFTNASITLIESTFIYNNAVQKPTVIVRSGGYVLVEGTHYTLSWSNSSSKDVGTYYVTATPTSNYSCMLLLSKSYVINCYSATAPTAMTGLKYVGTSQPLLRAGSTSYGTMVYSSNGTSWSQIVPTATDAGSYSVWWKVTGDTNVCNTGASSVSVSIAKAAGSVTIENIPDYMVFEEEYQYLSINITGGGEVECVSSDSNVVTIDSDGTMYGNDVGDCTITVTMKETNNYTSASTNFDIKCREISNALQFYSSEQNNYAFTNTVRYSTDGGFNWKTLDAGSSMHTEAGKTVMWMGELTPTSSSGVGRFSATNSYSAAGDITSLIYGEYFERTDYAPVDNNFRGLFSGSTTLVDAEHITMCSTLATAIYAYMFAGCTSLTKAPTLSAKALASGCYTGMFAMCTSLTTAPALPATELKVGCYLGMFSGCTSLTNAPVLSATTLVQHCYSYMFNDCSSLKKIDAHFTDTPNDTYTKGWVSGVASSGMFYQGDDASWYVRGVNGIPNGWTLSTVFHPNFSAAGGENYIYATIISIKVKAAEGTYSGAKAIKPNQDINILINNGNYDEGIDATVVGTLSAGTEYRFVNKNNGYCYVFNKDVTFTVPDKYFDEEDDTYLSVSYSGRSVEYNSTIGNAMPMGVPILTDTGGLEKCEWVKYNGSNVIGICMNNVVSNNNIQIVL